MLSFVKKHFVKILILCLACGWYHSHHALVKLEKAEKDSDRQKNKIHLIADALQHQNIPSETVKSLGHQIDLLIKQ